MERSESLKALAAALNKAQAEMSGAKKGASNPFFKSKYADLNAVVDAVRVPFAENGLSYSQFPIMEEGRVGVETILMHESGEFISSKLLLPMVKQDPQAAGSAITYARRYALQAIAGIPAEDDDGNSASNFQQQQPVKPQKPVSDRAASCVAIMEAANDMGQLDATFNKAKGVFTGEWLETITNVYNEQKERLTNG